MKMIDHLIKSNPQINNPESLDGGFNVFQQLKSKLIQIRQMKDKEEMKEDVLNQLSQAQVYVSLADLAQRDYAQVFNS